MREFTLKKKWDRLLLTLLFSVAVCTAAFAQERTVSGKVVDAKTHETIIGASAENFSRIKRPPRTSSRHVPSRGGPP